MRIPNLKSKTSRAALKPRREPYWHCIGVGLYLGFRRTREGHGTWIARKLEAPGGKKYLLHSHGALPDVRPEDAFDEASRMTQVWSGGVEAGATHRAVTVEEACTTYVDDLKTHKGDASAKDAAGRFTRLVYGKPIGAMQLGRLRAAHVRDWLNAQIDGDDEDLRRSKDSANRNLAALKAALNKALHDRSVATDQGWRTVERFPGAGRRRERFLSRAERTALLAQCPPDLAAFVTAVLLTAARPGELAKANVVHFDSKRGTLALRGKTGGRTVRLSDAARKLLRKHAADKEPGDPLLTDAKSETDGRWNKDSWKVRFRAAVQSAGLPEDVVLYSIRHAGISEMIAQGIDAFTVAKLAGTSTQMIDEHYGHLDSERTRARLNAVKML